MLFPKYLGFYTVNYKVYVEVGFVFLNASFLLFFLLVLVGIGFLVVPFLLIVPLFVVPTLLIVTFFLVLFLFIVVIIFIVVGLLKEDKRNPRDNDLCWNYLKSAR